MTIYVIPTQPSRYADETDKYSSADHVLVKIKGCYNTNHKLGLVGPKGECRREFQGPILAGPYAYPVALATVISAYKVEDAPELVVELEAGDTVVMNGIEFELVVRGREPHFIHIEGE